MSLSDKNLIITPNIGSESDPKIDFVGASTNTGPSTISAIIYPTNNGTLHFQATEGTLFSISNNLSTGSIFSVNPISGIPIIDVNADRTIKLNPFGGNTGIGTTNPTSKLDVVGDARFSGVITAIQFSTGNIGSAINIGTTSITGPSEILIDPAGLDDNTGIVRIKGDLYVDGTTITVNTESVLFQEFLVGIASTTVDDISLDGAGIGIGSTSIRKTFVYDYLNDSLSSSENINIFSNKSYKIGGTSVLSSTSLGSGVTNSSLTSVGALHNLVVSGVTTSTGGFVGDLTGNADTATALETARTFEITGDVIGSAVSFDGTGNVSIAATIQPNSVGLGTDTTGDYVTSISGTANEIEVTGGSGEGSTPQIGLPNNVVISNDLQVNNNAVIQGNLTVYGTETIVNTQSLNVFDKDIILGIGTDNGETDDTANGGGIAIASTEGSPLICLQCGVNTLPGTYKQLLWLKNGTFAGLATDSWITNYAVSIGTTVIDYGTRLAVGDIQITDDDIKTIRNIDATGIITATSFNGNLTGNVTGNADTATYAIVSGLSTNVIGGIGSLTTLNVSGISTFTNGPILVGSGTSTGTAIQPLQVTGGAYISGDVGIGTTNPTAKLQVSGDIKIDDGGTYSTTIQTQTPTADRVITYPDKTGTIALVAGSSGQVTFNLAGINTGDSNFTYDATSGLTLGRPLTVTDNLNVSDVSTFASNVDINASIDVDGHTELDNLNVSGVSTFASNVDINASIDISNNLNVTGVTTSTGGFVGDLTGNADTATYAVNAGISTNVIGGIGSITTLTVSGISTFSNNVNIAGTVSIGTTVDIVPYDDLGTLSFEGSAGQLFSITNNLTSGSIFSVNDVSGIPSIDVNADGTIQLAPYGSTEYVGIGLTNPQAKLDVDGDVNVSGVVTTSSGTLISGIGVSYNGVSIGSTITKIDFTGSGISTITESSGTVNINISADISPVMMGMIF